MGRPAEPKTYAPDFVLDHMGDYHPVLNNSIYRLARDKRWFIQANKASDSWQIFHGVTPQADGRTGVPNGKPTHLLRDARKRLLDGIAQGFYQTAP